MFVQGPKKFENDNSIELLKDTYNNLLRKIKERGYKNVLIPSLGTGDYGFKHEEVGYIVKELISNFVKENGVNVDIVLYSENDKNYYI